MKIKKLTKYLAKTGTIYCYKGGIERGINLWWWTLALCFWIGLMAFMASGKLNSACQFWQG